MPNLIDCGNSKPGLLSYHSRSKQELFQHSLICNLDTIAFALYNRRNAPTILAHVKIGLDFALVPAHRHLFAAKLKIDLTLYSAQLRPIGKK